MPFVPNVPGVPALSSFLTEPIPLLATDIAISLTQGLQSLQWGIYDQFGVPVIASALGPLVGLGPIVGALNSVSAFLLGQQLVNQFSVVDFEYKQEWNVSNAPVEQGGFQSYNKVQMPFDIRMRIAAGGSQDNRTSLLTVVDNLANAGLSAGIANLPSAVSSILSSPGLFSGIASAVAGSILGVSTSIPLYNVLTPEKIYQDCTVTHYDYKRSAINGMGILIVDIWLLQVRQTATAAFASTTQPVDSGVQSLGNVQPGPSTPMGLLVSQ